MNNRTRQATYLFNRPFWLESSGKVHAAGAYTIETEEKLIEGLFAAYRHVATTLIPQDRAPWESLRIYQVGRQELADAIIGSGAPGNVPQIPPWSSMSSQGRTSHMCPGRLT